MRKIAFIVPAALFAAIVLHHYSPAESYAEAAPIATPAATTPVMPEPVSIAPSTLPDCLSEDGNGQALCYWDAQTMGNGEGTSLVSGDCAADYVGGKANEATCVALYARGQKAIDYVGECVGIDNTISDKDRKNEGWDIGECFNAFK